MLELSKTDIISSDAGALDLTSLHDPQEVRMEDIRSRIRQERDNIPFTCLGRFQTQVDDMEQFWDEVERCNVELEQNFDSLQDYVDDGATDVAIIRTLQVHVEDSQRAVDVAIQKWIEALEVLESMLQGTFEWPEA